MIRSKDSRLIKVFTHKSPDNPYQLYLHILILTLNAAIATKYVCFSRLLKCLRSLYGKQCGLRSDSVLGTRCLLLNLICQLCWAIICSRRLQKKTFSDPFFFLGALRVNIQLVNSLQPWIFCRLLTFFKSTFSKNSFRNTI